MRGGVVEWPPKGNTDAKAGRPPYKAPPLKAIEKLSEEGWAAAKWAAEQEGRAALLRLNGRIRVLCEDRLKLARHHLTVAKQIQRRGVPGQIRDDKRQVISRAYYAMYHAVRALHFALRGFDFDDHQKLPEVVRREMGGRLLKRPTDKLYRALSRGRVARNEADYSPYYSVPLGRHARVTLDDAAWAVERCAAVMTEHWQREGIRRVE